MKPATIESRIVEVATPVDFKIVNFSKVHRAAPVVVVGLQPSGPDFFTTAKISGASSSTVLIDFAGPFQGSIHIHATSEK